MDIFEHTMIAMDRIFDASSKPQREPAAIPAPTTETLERFLSYVADQGSGCREWTGAASEGYGTFKLEGRTYRSHRVAYRFFIGEIPDGLMVLHSCDNRLCVNPEHLSVGTALDNTRDMIAKGRDRFASPPPQKEFCRNGHRYSEVGRYKTGACLQCRKEATHASYVRNKETPAATADKSHVMNARLEGLSPCDDAGTAGVVYPVTCAARYYDAASRILEEESGPGLHSHDNADELGHVIQKWIEETRNAL